MIIIIIYIQDTSYYLKISFYFRIKNIIESSKSLFLFLTAWVALSRRFKEEKAPLYINQIAVQQAVDKWTHTHMEEGWSKF